MLFGDEVVDCTILAQNAGRASRGHRFHHNLDVVLQQPRDYVAALRQAHVIVDFAERRG